MQKLEKFAGWRWWQAVALGVGISLLFVGAALAQSPAPEGKPQPSAVTADDGGAWELGVHGSAGNLTAATAAERAGMWYWLNGWFVRRYSYDETWAWENDFKRAALGGNENSYIDSVDLQFYVGHGSPGRFTFADTTHADSGITAPGDCDTTWGDGDNEWLALTSCQVLADSGIGPMAQCMNHQHLILGFVTNASAWSTTADTQAYHFGRFMRSGYSMTQSWFKACDTSQRGRTTRVIAEDSPCFDDNPYYGSVCPDSYDSTYYWQTHNCGTEMAGPMPLAQMGNQLPVFQFAPYGLDDAAKDYSMLGNVFGIPVTGTLQAAGLLEGPGSPPGSINDPNFLTTNVLSRSLEIDTHSGIFNYANLNQLWTGSAVQQAMAVRSASVNTIGNDLAQRIADSFLTQNGLMPGDATFYEVVTDTAGTLPKGNVLASAVSEAETPLLLQVIYSRKITAPVVMASGVMQDLNFTVVGPGAKQKVYLPEYLPPGVSAADALATLEPFGVQGGWRELGGLVVDAATGRPRMATIFDQATAQDLYRTLPDDVSMSTVPLDVQNREILSTTVAYYEMGPGSQQAQLIPVYEFTVRYTEKGTGSQTVDVVDMPASPEYLRPLARILNAPAAGVDPQSTVTLTAADASQTLKALGFGNAFDFVMGYNGANGTYAYKWYLGSVAPENEITDLNTADGPRTVSFKVPQSNSDKGKSFSVYLVVTDTDSPNPSSSTAVAEITIKPAIYVPIVHQ